MADLLPFPALPSLEKPELPDAAARRRALDIQRSFVVEAPAGSGKTGLLIQRFLRLLGDVNVTSPEQVLAITFTRKATSEMHDRVLSQLAAAENGTSVPDSDFDRETRELALAVLARDRELGWSLLMQPGRLRIRTIDALCTEIARMLPVLTGSGGGLSPTDQAQPLYHEAARRTLLCLGGKDASLHRSLREVLLHRDGNLADCEDLIAGMLSLREQWAELIWGMLPANEDHALDDAYLDANVLPRLETAMDTAICAALSELHRAFPPDILDELADLASRLTAADAASEIATRVTACAGRPDAPAPCSEDLQRWKLLSHLLITPSSDEWRKQITARNLGVTDLTPAAQNTLRAVLSRVGDRDELMDLLCAVRELPPACYPADQWRVAKALFRVLHHAMAELQVVFAERNQCDFAELSLMARHALSQNSGADDLAEAIGSRLQHLLVDEMQDTSSSQYHLLEVLTRSWDGHSQTVFLVGDPRQSIYLFRQARVERFLAAIRERRIGDLPLEHLKLTSNFRSQQHLVENLNDDFSAIFPAVSDPLPYTQARAVLPPSNFASGTVWHADIVPYAAPSATPSRAELQQQQRGRDAQTIIRIVREWLEKPLPAGRRHIISSKGDHIPEPWRIAVLVRNRNHLNEIVAALRAAHPTIPYRAVNIEALSERQEIFDLTALTRALLHPADRVAGLAVLRAPWCGLTLADLHLLTGADDPALRYLSVPALLQQRGPLLAEGPKRRAARVASVLESAASQRGRISAAQLVEKAWRSLGGDVLLNPFETANARRFFRLLADAEADAGDLASAGLAALEGRLRDLFAEAEIIPPETPHVELLTIHKAKGLEWDVVIIPGMERFSDRGRPRLLTWTTLDSADERDGAAHVLLAPIAARGNDPDSLTRWINRMHAGRERAENKRLFYVACTRAREELHLFAAPSQTSKGEVKPQKRTLLEAAWPAARLHFQQTSLPSFRQAVEEPGEPEAFEIAASAAPSPHTASVRRLPLSYDARARFAEAQRVRIAFDGADAPRAPGQMFQRPEGSFAARSFGNAIHTSLELLSRRIAAGADAAVLRSELASFTPRIATLLRADGLPRATAGRLTRDAIRMLDAVLTDRDGLWILAPHPGAASEFSLSAASAAGAEASTVRADRIFKAGPAPHTPGADFLWIVDYKTSAPAGSAVDAFLNRQREAYAEQLQAYARILAPTLGSDAHQVRVGLYFPALPRLLWWDPTVAR